MHYLISFIIVFSLSSYSLAIDNPDSPFQESKFETEYKEKWKKFEQAKSTKDGDEALQAVLKLCQTTLTELQTQAQANVEKDLYEKILASNKLWESYLEKENTLLIFQSKKNPASSQNSNLLMHKITLYKQRIEILQQFLRTL